MHRLRNTGHLAWTVGGVATAALVLSVALSLHTPPALAGLPTPTPEPILTWTFDVSPVSPVVGDDIKLTAYASGDGGLPKYTLILKDSPALLALESNSSVATGGPLGVPASWDLRALGEGKAHFHISVNYEREFCSPSGCFFAFTIDESPQMTFDIGAGIAVGGSASLPRLASDAPSSGPPAVVAIALIIASASLGLGAVAWVVRRRARG